MLDRVTVAISRTTRSIGARLERSRSVGHQDHGETDRQRPRPPRRPARRETLNGPSTSAAVAAHRTAPLMRTTFQYSRTRSASHAGGCVERWVVAPIQARARHRRDSRHDRDDPPPRRSRRPGGLLADHVACAACGRGSGWSSRVARRRGAPSAGPGLGLAAPVRRAVRAGPGPPHEIPVDVRATTRDGVPVLVLAEATVSIPRPVVGTRYADPWPAAELAAEETIARSVTGWSAAELAQTAECRAAAAPRAVGQDGGRRARGRGPRPRARRGRRPAR